MLSNVGLSQESYMMLCHSGPLSNLLLSLGDAEMKQMHKTEHVPRPRSGLKEMQRFGKDQM